MMTPLGDLPVFPCNLDKEPLTKHGFKSAQRIEPPQRWPLVGVPTGEATGFDVLDIDEEGLDWLKANPLPPTRVHQTPHGFHYLLQPAEGLAGSADQRIAAGIHVRATGNYVIWWPRQRLKVIELPLTPWPAELLERARSKANRIHGHRSETPRWGGCETRCVVSPGSREARYAKGALRNAFDKLAQWPRWIDPADGKRKPRRGRNNLLNKLAFKLGGLVANGWIDGEAVIKVLMLGAAECKLVRDDGAEQCHATILSGLNAGMQFPYPALGPFPEKHNPYLGVSYQSGEILE